ncbi:MAG: hypothetical protein ACREPV_07245 [Lysobacter sp.]
MAIHRWVFAGLLGVAGVATWLLLAGPDTLLGIDTGNAGMVLLITATWVSLYLISRMPRGDAEFVVSPGEWKAWIGVGFMVVAITYFLSRLQVFAHAGPWEGANIVGRNLVMLLIAWTILSRVLKSQWQGQVEEDERDRQITIRSKDWGYGAMISFVIGLALMLGFSPAHKLEWASHFMIGNLLVFSLMVACLFEHAARAVLYLRDRV